MQQFLFVHLPISFFVDFSNCPVRWPRNFSVAAPSSVRVCVCSSWSISFNLPPCDVSYSCGSLSESSIGPTCLNFPVIKCNGKLLCQILMKSQRLRTPSSWKNFFSRNSRCILSDYKILKYSCNSLPNWCLTVRLMKLINNLERAHNEK